ncbi:MAG: UbiH/UbiF/VisC/COQ6 family ubiquinone biosynthesis hydroxylase [Mariprofundaceae bacterium]|nr:UbiH/UbiF/VisC/COQ6 family ubiquinone biosynthesis hydroxylase [Mariprofundaceae bacterium]
MSTPYHTHSTHADVVIVGGGMVGLCLACALKDSGLHIILIERGQAPIRYSLARDCRVSAIVYGNQQILEHMGAWQHMAANAQAIESMQVWDAHYAGGIRFESEEINTEALGWLVENSVLQAGLRRAIAEANKSHVEIWMPAELTGVTFKARDAALQLEDGRQIITPLVVGADGARSWLRQQAGIGVYQRDYKQRGIVATVRAERAHHGVAYQRFLATGPLAVLPMTGGLSSIVWSANNAEANRLQGMDDAVFLAELNHQFGPVLGRIVAVGARFAFPLKGQLAHHLVRHRLALIGDAAHCIHPLAGLGVNLGLRDAMVLAQEIIDARRFDEDWGEQAVLARYMRMRLPDVLSTMAAMEGLHRVFTASLPVLPYLRGMAMKGVGNAGIFKTMLMQQSTGISLPVPTSIRVY